MLRTLWTQALITTVVITSFTLSGCSASSTPSTTSSSSSQPVEPSLSDTGRAIYEKPLGGSRFACADCHALDENADQLDDKGFRRAGHPIGDALRRPHFKNTQLTAFVDAANSCLDEWMGTTITWNNNTEEYLALAAYLTANDTGTGDAPALSFTLKPTGVPSEQGSVAAGAAAFNKTCAVCHGKDGVWDNNPLGIDIRYITDSAADAAAVARKVRRSGSSDSPVYQDLVGGIMPFWSAERLTDQELADITAFLASTRIDAEPTTPTTPPTTGSTCDATSARIGQTAELRTLQHGVSGTATIVDDCTIKISNFNYDGQGVDVEFYASANIAEFANNNGSYYSITPNRNFLRQSQPYVNEEVIITLPAGRTLDTIGAISLWCVDFDIDFGSGSFQ
ncbi:DM13 domain-containing protein [Marinagarivorans algicola]|uniref:DM13 domain-containing protein n=1 Tax=Marinagarivorans algicola TaxID=1513270 RepID=UPI0006B547E6|nr:DM13 domain-containing protein [Marinagarivorans algicola]